jgi:deoxyribonuclease-4
MNNKINKFLGAHVSVSGGVFKAPKNANDIGGVAFAMFLKNQKRWVAKDYDEKLIAKFNEEIEKYKFNKNFIMPHAGYLINLANNDPEKWQKSYDALVDELKRGEQLGLKYVNLHCGSHLGLISVEEGCELIARGINHAIKETDYITVVLENTAGKGNTIGGDFKELKLIIDKIEDKSRIGVLLDTCHTFDYGYDLATEEGYKKTFEEFEKTIGFKYLKGIHLNDSMYGLGCKKDRHESIGKGLLGMDFFKRFMNDPRFDNMPITLETINPDIWDEEIKLLYSLIED